MDDYLDGRGSIGMLAGLLGIVTFGGAAVLILGRTVVQIVALGAVALSVIGLLLAVVLHSSKVERRARRAERVLHRYCAGITDQMAPGEAGWRIISWENIVQVGKNGDTRERLTVTVMIMSDRFQFFRLTNGSGWLQSARQRRGVRVEPSNVTVLEKVGEGGVRWHLTSTWKSDGKLEVLAHCRDEVRAGTVVTARLFYSWPAKCTPLVNGESDLFQLRFKNGIEYIDYSVILPDSREVDVEDSVKNPHIRPTITSDNDRAGGRRRIRLEARDVPPGEAVGMKLTVKGAPSARRAPLR